MFFFVRTNVQKIVQHLKNICKRFKNERQNGELRTACAQRRGFLLCCYSVFRQPGTEAQ
jgi:hypothetical protein